MSRGWILRLLLLAFVLSASGRAAPASKVEMIGACTSSEASDAVKKTLQTQGTRVVKDSGALCEVWLRQVLPQTAGTGTDYNTLATGTFVGIIRYVDKGGDYKGQSIKPGVYTMRYQTIPSDGNHMGVSPTPDFLVLTPAASDKDPDAVIEYQELLRLGKQASGSNHIYPLYLTAPAGDGSTSLRSIDENHSALEAKTKAQPKGGAVIDFPMAIVLIGKSEA